MSDITITQKNLPRFTKRLKKSLEAHFSKEIALHEASKIFSQTLGLENTHQLQEKLQKNNTSSAVLIGTYIEGYFRDNKKTKISSFSLAKDAENFYFLISSIEGSGGAQSQGAFGLFFTDTPTPKELHYIEKEMARFDFTQEDERFINSLVQMMHFDNSHKMQVLKQELISYFNFSRDGFYEFKKDSRYVQVNNYGFCESMFALVDEREFSYLASYLITLSKPRES